MICFPLFIPILSSPGDNQCVIHSVSLHLAPLGWYPRGAGLRKWNAPGVLNGEKRNAPGVLDEENGMPQGYSMNRTECPMGTG